MQTVAAAESRRDDPRFQPQVETWASGFTGTMETAGTLVDSRGRFPIKSLSFHDGKIIGVKTLPPTNYYHVR